MLTAAAAPGPDWPAPAASNVVIVLSLVLAVVAGVLALLDKRLARWLLVLVGLVEVALVVMAVQCVVAWAGGSAPLEPAVFLAYLLVCLAAAPASYSSVRIGSPNSISHFEGSGISPSGPSSGNSGVIGR